MRQALNKALRPLALRLRHMLVFGRVALADPSKGVQLLQASMLSGEERDGIPHMEPYGFTSRPHPGAEALFACLGGLREQPVALCVGDRRWRIKDLETGEVALYTDEGDRVVLGRNGVVQITASATVEITAPLVHITGDLEVSGEITDRAETNNVSLTEFRTVFNAHRHNERNLPNEQPTRSPDLLVDN